jgi:hypothetical protein
MGNYGTPHHDLTADEPHHHQPQTTDPTTHHRIVDTDLAARDRHH